MRETVVQARQLCKTYGKTQVLDHVDFTVNRGDIYGLIGRNGAGKTTIMKILTGLTEKSSGEYELFSVSSQEAGTEKCRIGCLIENPAFYPNLTAYQNLKYFAIQRGMVDMSQIDEVLRLVKLENTGKKKFKAFSLGMKQRLGIAQALLDNPDLIILDEPINGLDPIGISELRDTFRMLNEERGITIVISSHILTELYAVCNRFLFIEQGQIIKEMNKQELDLACRRCVAIETTDTSRAVTVLEEKLRIKDYAVTGPTEIRVYEECVDFAEINKTLVQNEVEVTQIQITGVSLEDYFKSLIGGQAHD